MSEKHNHSHDHDHHLHHAHRGGHGHGHSHAHVGTAPHKTLIFAIILTLTYAIIEALSGWWSNSLVLLGDAGHMASDTLALSIAAFAAWIALRPPSQKHSYGLGRAEVLAAWISSLILLAISIAVIVEAVNRIHTPEVVKGGPIMIVAFIGLLLNIFIAWLLAKGERTLNIRAALLHVFGDIIGSLTAVVAGAIIYFTGWFPIDPILSIFIGVLIIIASLRLLRESLLILMEGVPGHLDIKAVKKELSVLEGVKGVHDLHIWTLSSGNIALSAHIDIREMSSWCNVLEELRNTLKHEFDIHHVTLQPEAEIIDCKPCKH
jgi:cobalt-zinc-cadmium efflux system protein